jgi:lipopolysaccharide transport system ATP-binding protein
MTTAISIENVSKYYRLGMIGGGTLAGDLNRWWARVRGQPDPLLKVGERDLGDRQGEFIWALRDVSFDVQQGEAVGIIGRNGAGKSTLLKVLSRVTAPTSGIVKAKGRIASLLEVGTGFHQELTGRENIYLNGAIMGMSRDEVRRKFDEIVDFSGVEQFIDTPVKRYSSGMYVRLAFAVAAHLEPEILVVDEVLAVGDAEFQKKCLGKMEDVTQEGRTVLFVSHNMTAITSLCKRGILLSGGRVVLDGTTEQTISNYLTNLQDYQKLADGFLSLTEHPGRVLGRYDNFVRLTHCRILDSHQKPSAGVRSGDELRVAIGYQMAKPIESSLLTFVITFTEGLQRRLFSCSSSFVNHEFVHLAQTGEVQCVIPKVPLVPGTYTLNLGCKVSSSNSDVILDAVELQVLPGDYYGTGRLPPKEWGAVLVDYDWDVTL